MWTSEKVSDRVRARLVALIELEERVCGSTVVAMKTVARRVGTSHAWVKRVVGRYEGAAIHAHLLLNILREHIRRKRAARKAVNAQRVAQRNEARPGVYFGIARIKTRTFEVRA